MKKITLILLLLSLFSNTIEAQITTFPYTEDFESGDGGWVANNITNGTWALGTPVGAIINTAASGTNSWVTNLSGNYNSNEDSSVTSPVFDFSSLATPSIEMSIWYDAESSWDGTVLQSSIDGGTTWVNVGAFGDSNNWYTDNAINGNPGGQQEGWSGSGTQGTNAWVTAKHPLTGLGGQSNVIFRVAFGSDGSLTNEGFSFDDVSIFEVSCPEPSAMTASNLTDNSVDLSWTSGNTEITWNIEWNSGADFAPGTGAEEASTTVNTTPATSLTGLTPSTQYFVYYQANCSADGVSAWVGPFIFTTSNVPPPSPVGVTCTSGTSSFVFIAEFDVVDGWTGDINDGDGTWKIPGNTNSTNTGPDAAFSGVNYMNFEGSGVGNITVASAVTPAIDLSDAVDGAELSFYMHAFGADMGTLNVGVSNSAAGPFTNLYTWAGELQTSGSDPWIPIGVNLDAYLGQIIYLEFNHAGTVYGTGAGWEGDMSIDFVRVETCGMSCIAPNELAVTNITDNSADISWTANSGETNWMYVVQPAGTGVPVSGTATTTTNISETGLTPSTIYEVYVQANCASDDSVWAGPIEFTTEIQFDVTIDCVNDPSLTIDYCYDNGGDITPELFTFTSNDGTSLNLTFNTGIIESGWDELVVIDSNGTPFPGFDPADNNYGNAGDISGLTFQSTGDTISWYVNSDGSVSCQDGSPGEVDGINFTVSCATCVNPQATYTVIDDCANGDQFLIDVDITDIGDATSLTISNNINTDTTPVTTTGTYQVGPFPFLVDVVITVSSDQDNNCVINSSEIHLLTCPPANDNCDGAITAVVNADENCTDTTPGTILAATMSGVPNGSCVGNPNDDVWFQFVALAEQQIIDIQNITGGTTNIDHAVYEGTCTNLTELYCSDETNSLTPVLTVGNTYYIRIFSAGNNGTETSTFDLCISTFGTATYCLDALPICPDPDINYPSIVGDQVAPPYIDYDCLFTQPDPQWNTIQFNEAGDYMFSLDQVDDTGVPADIDFIIWGPFTDQQSACAGLLTTNIADCSYEPLASETIELTDVPANSVYVILITNFSESSGTYTLTQDSGPVDGVNCEIVCDVTLVVEGVDIEDDIDTPGIPDEEINYCGFNSVELSASTAYNVDQYIWFFNGFVIPGASGPTYTATQSGTYQVQVLGGICDQSVLYFSALVQLNLYDEAPIIANQELTFCDIDGNGTEDFDLDALTTSLNLSSDFVVTYYTSTSDANQAINAVSSPYTSSGEILIIRIEDANAVANGYLGCRQLSQVTLTVNDNPAIGTPNNLIECSSNDNANFDLTSNDNVVLGSLNPSDYTVSYHISLVDADANTNALISPYTNTTNPETIYVRLEDNTTGCYSTASFDLIVYTTASVGTVADQVVCDPENDGSETFNLDALTTSFGLGADFVVTYHTNTSDANAGTGAVASPYTSSGETLYIRIDDADAVTDGYLSCAEITQVELIVNPLPVINTPADFIVCDDVDGNVDGITEFDLTSIDTEVTTDANVTVTYYTSQTDADNGTNSLSNPYTSSGETIYIRAEDNTTGCFNTTSFNIGVDIIPLANFDAQFDYIVCPDATVPISIGIIPDNFTASEVTINWSLDGNAIAGNGLILDTVLASGDYTAEIIFNSTGCSNTITQFVDEFEFCEFPQGISPNGDGLNDTFDLRPFAVTELKIFNRNGNLVYERNNYVDEWFGQTDDGEELPVGTYFYTVIYENGTKSKSAWVYINR